MDYPLLGPLLFVHFFSWHTCGNPGLTLHSFFWFRFGPGRAQAAGGLRAVEKAPPFLKPIVIPSEDEHTATAIFLHGFNSR